MKAVTIVDRVRDGHLPLHRRQTLQGILQENDGKMVRITIEPWHGKTTEQQRKYWWSVLVKTLMDADVGPWQDPHSCHRWLLRTYAATMQPSEQWKVGVDGAPYPDLNALESGQFTVLINKVVQEYLQHDIEIPPPPAWQP